MTVTDLPRKLAEIVDPGELLGFDYQVIVSQTVKLRELRRHRQLATLSRLREELLEFHRQDRFDIQQALVDR